VIIPALPPFQHLMAFGNSDQESFRDLRVRACFDVMTVPGTIASYYDEATAAFVLSSKMPYLIDPRTPLFQDELTAPRASHLTLADWHGPSVRARLPENGPAYFPDSLYSPAVVREMVREVVDRQRSYAGNAPRVTKKLDRYARLLAQAMQQQQAPVPAGGPAAPTAVLAPYFAVTGTADPWFSVLREVWTQCAALASPRTISPVLCVGPRQEQTSSGTVTVDGIGVLGELLPLLPQDLARTCYIWITGLDERAVREDQLRRLWRTVQARPGGLDLINLYGGFFSICLRYAGLAGFGNGLTYSESRAWPALSSTGSAPPRYYIRDLHLFLSPAAAQAVVAAESAFECPCDACVEVRARGQSIASMPYHSLKRHFAHARRWELDQVAQNQPGFVAASMTDAKRRLEAVRRVLPRGVSPQSEHLTRWANVLLRP
jgi:hypothetical protein